eukprot:357386-Chlamydomonas_euryale.AAC.2
MLHAYTPCKLHAFHARAPCALHVRHANAPCVFAMLAVCAPCTYAMQGTQLIVHAHRHEAKLLHQPVNAFQLLPLARLVLTDVRKPRGSLARPRLGLLPATLGHLAAARKLLRLRLVRRLRHLLVVFFVSFDVLIARSASAILVAGDDGAAVCRSSMPARASPKPSPQDTAERSAELTSSSLSRSKGLNLGLARAADGAPSSLPLPSLSCSLWAAGYVAAAGGSGLEPARSCSCTRRRCRADIAVW